MSFYDANKDKLIKLFEMEDENKKKSLLFSIFSYDNGSPKLGFSRTFKKKDETLGYGALGRVTIEELEYLKNNIDEMIKIMKTYDKK